MTKVSELLARDDVKALMAKPMTPDLVLMAEIVRALTEGEIAAWLRWYAGQFPSFDDYLDAADAIEAGEPKPA
jgi:hypothetical protein